MAVANQEADHTRALHPPLVPAPHRLHHIAPAPILAHPLVRPPVPAPPPPPLIVPGPPARVLTSHVMV